MTVSGVRSSCRSCQIICNTRVKGAHIIVVVDLDHGRIDARAEALGFYDGEKA